MNLPQRHPPIRPLLPMTMRRSCDSSSSDPGCVRNGSGTMSDDGRSAMYRRCFRTRQDSRHQPGRPDRWPGQCATAPPKAPPLPFARVAISRVRPSGSPFSDAGGRRKRRFSDFRRQTRPRYQFRRDDLCDTDLLDVVTSIRRRSVGA